MTTLPPIDQWGTFQLGDTSSGVGLFNITKGTRLSSSDRSHGNVAYIGATAFNNGVADMCDAAPNAPAGCITVSYNGSIGEAFFHSSAVFACDDTNVLVPKTPLTEAAALFVCTAIRHEAFRYTYSRKWTLPLMKATTIRLPVTDDGTPDWELMESYIHWIHGVGIPRRKAAEKAERDRRARPLEEPIALPDVSEWGEFQLGNIPATTTTPEVRGLFDIQRGGKTTPGTSEVPYVTSSLFNNGISDRRVLEAVYPAGTLTVACDGSIGATFYQTEPYASNSHVCILTPNDDMKLNAATALFLGAVIRHEGSRYSFSHAWSLERMRNTQIKLPVTTDGTPDWALMARYIRGTRHSHRLVHGEDAA